MEPKSNRVIDVINWGRELFVERRISHARYHIEVLLEHILGKKRAELYGDYDYRLSAREMELLRGFIRRRLDRRPLWHLVGEVDFFGLPFQVTDRVLIPRPETEVLVETALRELAMISLDRLVYLLDMGTGSGNIAIALSSRQDNLFVYATDISQDALAVAEANARANGVEGAISFACGDLFEPFGEQGRSRLDMIVSNPPYVSDGDWAELPVEVREREPREALDGGEDGLRIIRRLVEEAPRYLVSGGCLIIEVGRGQAFRVRRMMLRSGEYGRVEVCRDYSGIERVLLATRR